MRFLRFLAVISLALLPEAGSACYNPWFYTMSPTIYRVEVPADEELLSKKRANLLEWQAMTSKDISLEDIEAVVYTMPLDAYETFYAAKSYGGTNAFAHWIKDNDPAIMEFLLLAKRNEWIRFQYNSLWYYPSMKIGGPTTLEEIVTTSLANNDERLHSRYMLQAMRALYTLNRYEECVEIWDREFVDLPEEDAMRRHAYLYIAGSLYRLGNVDEAIRRYAEVGDIDSIIYIAELENLEIEELELLELLAKANPNNPDVFTRVKRFIYDEEGYLFSRWEPSGNRAIKPESIELCDMAMRLAREGYNPVFWYYTASYIYYMMDMQSEAYNALALAQNASPSPYMSDSLRALNILYDARYQRLGKSYDQQLQRDIKWLIQTSFKYTDEIDSEFAKQAQFYVFPTNAYYWKAMTQYVVNEVLVPRYLEHGDTVRALQLANMSSNYMITDSTLLHVEYYDSEAKEWVDYGYDYVASYRRLMELNDLDYSTFFFYVADGVDPDAMAEYIERVKSPKGELDKLLNKWSYVNMDYLNDIAGTLYLRSMRYADAERHLSLVSYDYFELLNVKQKYDPFSFKKSRARVDDFRLEFARKMNDLEQDIMRTTEPNRRARLMISYAIGLNNSFTRCWELTHYYVGSLPHVYRDRAWINDAQTTAARVKANSMVNEALATITDPNYAAEANYLFNNFKTVGTRYSHTYYGRLVRSSCDNLCDYHSERGILPGGYYF